MDLPGIAFDIDTPEDQSGLLWTIHVKTARRGDTSGSSNEVTVLAD
jgi:hypothetical protein